MRATEEEYKNAKSRQRLEMDGLYISPLSDFIKVEGIYYEYKRKTKRGMNALRSVYLCQHITLVINTLGFTKSQSCEIAICHGDHYESFTSRLYISNKNQVTITIPADIVRHLLLGHKQELSLFLKKIESE